jgi:hypothetical protein
MNQLNQLINRLSERTGLKFYQGVNDGEYTELPQEKGFQNQRVGFILVTENGKIPLEYEWTLPIPPDALNQRLIQALALEIYQDITRYDLLEGSQHWTWDKLLQRAFQEGWSTETFHQKVKQYNLPRLEFGYPVYIHCSSWPEELTEVIKLFFPQAIVRWLNAPDLFLWIPVEDKEASLSEIRLRGEEFIQEIYTLLADELGITSTILIGEASRGDIWEEFIGVRQLLEIHRRFFPGQSGLVAWNLGLSLLLSEVPAQVNQNFITKTLGSLPDDLVETLVTFLDHDLSISETAKALFIHRNTLIYRLERITELTGYNPRRVFGAVHLYLAIWLSKHQYSNR